MKRLYSLLFIFIFLQVFAAYGQIKPSDTIPVDPEVRVGQLPNGLKYYVRQNSVADGIVHMRLVVKAGSMEEEPGQLGIAHFMEHMNFNGVEGYSKVEIINYLNSAGVQLGSDLNAYTSYNETVFVLPVPGQNKKAVDQGFAIMAGWAAHALLDTVQVNKERGVILEESRIRKGADQRFRDQYLPLILGGSGFAYRQPIGKDSLIKKFTAADLRRFYRTWYRPDLMAVIVVGDINPDSAIAEITRRFGPLTNPEREKALPKVVIAGREAPVALLLKDKEAVNTELKLYFNTELDRGAVTWAGGREKMVERLLIYMLNNRLVESESDWQKVNVDTAFLIYKKIFGNANGLHFTFVGDFDPDSIQSALAYWIGGLPSFPAPHHFVDVHLRPIQGNYKIVLKRGLDRKTVLELVSNGVGAYSQEEQTKLEITAMVLQLEVNELLRQKMGKLYAEVFRSTMTKEPFAGYTINMTFWLAPQNLDTILHYTTGIINRLRDEGPTADVLEKAKAIFQEHTKADLGENYYWLVQLSHAWLQGESYGSILHRTKIIKDVTANDVREAVRKYFQLDKFVEAILEPEEIGSAH